MPSRLIKKWNYFFSFYSHFSWKLSKAAIWSKLATHLQVLRRYQFFERGLEKCENSLRDVFLFSKIFFHRILLQMQHIQFIGEDSFIGLGLPVTLRYSQTDFSLSRKFN